MEGYSIPGWGNCAPHGRPGRQIAVQLLVEGHPRWSTAEKMNGRDEQELRSCTVEAPLTWSEKSTHWLIPFVSGPGRRRFRSLLNRRARLPNRTKSQSGIGR